VTGNLSSLLGWRWACVACSAGVYIGVFLAIPVFKDYVPPVRSKQGETAPARLVRNRPAVLLILGYWGHMWEMYGMRNWLVPFFTVSFLHWGMGQPAAAAWAANGAALAIAMGGLSTAITGTLSDRLGRSRTVMLVMVSSAVLSFALGWMSGVHPWIVLAAGLAYGYLVAAESPVFSTGLTEVVPPGHLGQAMGVQSLVGYSAAMISATVFGWALDVFKGWEPFPGVGGDWVIAFSTLGAGALVGPVCMALLRRSPESLRMAGGRR
jgi:MFS family permease